MTTLPELVSRNGRMILPAEAHISIFNPVIFGAFGVYESIQLFRGAVFLLDDHLERLAESAAAIELELPADLSTIATWTHEAIAANGCQDALIRLFALGPTVHAGAEVFIWPESPRTFAPEMFEQGVGAVSYHGERALPHAKSLNTLVNHLARVRALQAGEHEGLLLSLIHILLAIASGRRLRWRQEDIKPKGWAIECRITAEDPINNFMPSGGKISTLQEPTGPGVRVESGIYEGFEVSLFYDPMIAKLIVWGETRAEAILRMRRALNEYRIGGLKTSIPFHQQMMNSTQFMWGAFDTNFLQDRFAITYTERPEMELSAAIAAAMVEHTGEQRATVIHRSSDQGGSSWKRSSGWKLSLIHI